MTRAALFLSALAVMLLVFAPAASADGHTQPSQGDRSVDRNEAGVGGGPHCHVLSVDHAQQESFANIWVFPSHRAHVATGTPNVIFAGDADCNGIPG
jgi:hypothetical protein